MYFNLNSHEETLRVYLFKGYTVTIAVEIFPSCILSRIDEHGFHDVAGYANFFNGGIPTFIICSVVQKAMGLKGDGVVFVERVCRLSGRLGQSEVWKMNRTRSTRDKRCLLLLYSQVQESNMTFHLMET